MAEQSVAGGQQVAAPQNAASVVKTTQSVAASSGAAPAAAMTSGDAGAQGAFTVPQDMLEWGKAKGLNSMATWANDPEAYKMAVMYRDTEKFIGGDKIPLPKDMNDNTALSTVFEKLGKPKDAKDYKLQIPEGHSDAFAQSFRSAAHQSNLTQKQAETLNTWWNGMVDGLLKQEDTQRAEKAASDKIGLEKDWPGDKFGANQEVATRAIAKIAGDLGIPRDNLADKLQDSLGLRDAMRLLHYVGNMAKVTGDSFEGGGHGDTRGGSKLVMSAEEATQAKNDLFKTKDNYIKYKKGDPEIVKRVNDLNAVIAAERNNPTRTSTGQPGKAA